MSFNAKYLVIFIASLLLFVPFLGQVHLFDWDEINFAECAREMIVSKDYLRMQIDFQPFYEKPPLFIWLQVLSMKLWGLNEFAARFPNAIAGTTTLLLLFYVGKKVANEKIAEWWVLLYAASWLPHFYFKTGIIDPIFNLFIFLAFFQVYSLKDQANKIKHILLAGFFLGLAVLTKGPVALLVSGISLVVYLIINRGLRGYHWIQFVSIVVVAVLVTSVWFGVELAQNGPKFLQEFLRYQVGLFSQNIADHEEPWYYHPIILMIGCFPAIQFLFQYTFKRNTSRHVGSNYARWMWILFWVVLILFSIVKTKIVHYSSLCYFPLTYLAAVQLYRISERQIVLKKIVTFLLLIVGSLWGIILIAIPIVGLNKAKIIPHVQDPFAVGNLQAQVSWHMIETIWGLLYLAVIWISVLLLRRNFTNSIKVLILAQIVMIQVTILHFTPKVEAYSQRAAIAFYKSLKGRDVYVQVIGFRSYAHLFYTQKNIPQNNNYYHQDWLLNGPVDKPTYLVCKIQNADQYRRLPQLKVLYEKNGFVFFQRLPNKL